MLINYFIRWFFHMRPFSEFFSTLWRSGILSGIRAVGVGRLTCFRRERLHPFGTRTLVIGGDCWHFHVNPLFFYRYNRSFYVCWYWSFYTKCSKNKIVYMNFWRWLILNKLKKIRVGTKNRVFRFLQMTYLTLLIQ